MEEKEMEKKFEELEKQINEKICNVLEVGIQNNNIDILGKLIDMHKDLANEKYWKKKEEMYNDEEIRKLSWWI